MHVTPRPLQERQFELFGCLRGDELLKQFHRNGVLQNARGNDNIGELLNAHHGEPQVGQDGLEDVTQIRQGHIAEAG